MDNEYLESRYAKLTGLAQIREEKQLLLLRIHQKETRIRAHIKEISAPFSFLAETGSLFSGIVRMFPWFQGLRLGFRLIYSLLKKNL